MWHEIVVTQYLLPCASPVMKPAQGEIMYLIVLALHTFSPIYYFRQLDQYYTKFKSEAINLSLFLFILSLSIFYT